MLTVTLASVRVTSSHHTFGEKQMNGGYVTHHNAEAIEAFFGPYQQNDHVKLYLTHLQVLDMERINREMCELIESGEFWKRYKGIEMEKAK